ncbi:hypothetical protein BGZ82_004020 [Podila clonocystis]|nr:hypothetical protein BGZ82_004020 [Podila clonocystis]
MSGVILCAASNQEAVYTLNWRIIGGDFHFVLARSSNNRTATLSAPWQIIAVSSFEDLDPNDDNLLQTLLTNECSVDNNGTFYLWTRKDNEYNIFKFASNSHSTISSSNKCRKKNPLTGQWSKTSINLSTNVIYKHGVSVQDPRNTTGAATVVFHPHVEEALPPITPPTFLYVPTNTTWSDITLAKQDMKSMVLTNTSAAIFNMVYGDNQMFALLKSMPDDPTSRIITYKQTLTYFPFPPNNLTSTARPVSVPWNVTCTDSEYWDKNKARAANGKFYYMCEESNQYAGLTTLYIHDSRTSKTQRVSLGTTTGYIGSFILAYGPASQTDPQFAVIFGVSGCVIDLSTLNKTDGPDINSILYDEVPFSAGMIYDICGRPGEELSIGEQFGIAIGVIAALAVLGWVAVRWWRKRATAKLPQGEAVVSGLPVYDDEAIPGGRHVELAVMPPTSEERRVDAEGEAPPRYEPRS